MTTRRPTYAERRARADARRAERAAIDDPAVVLEAAAAFLAVRPRSVAETRRRLRHLGYAATPIDVAIDRLVEFGYLDDAAFAAAWVESRDRARPRGEAALRRELRLKGIDPELIAAVLAGRELDAETEAVRPPRDGDAGPASDVLRSGSADEDAARRLLTRRATPIGREGDPRRRRQKAYALLARHGFGPDVCARVSAEVVETLADDDQEALLDGV